MAVTRKSARLVPAATTTVKRRAPGQRAAPTRARSTKPTSTSTKRSPPRAEQDDEEEDDGSSKLLASKKWKSWSQHATSSPFPSFGRPDLAECHAAFRVLERMHSRAVEAEFEDAANTPETIPVVLDALVVAILSQATSWANAKRAMGSMRREYGSVFAYDEIVAGGRERLQEALRCGGLHVRKSKIIMSILGEVRDRHGRWDLDHLFREDSDEEAMRELLSYKYVGPKSAFVVMTWCLKRGKFTVDTHVYRIARLWGWAPERATREETQAHLDAVVPPELKLRLHFLLIAHGRVCPACRGGSKSTEPCRVQEELGSK